MTNSNRKCGEITFCSQVGKRVYALNCLYCPQICLQWEMFINHLEQEHAKYLSLDCIVQPGTSKPKIEMDAQDIGTDDFVPQLNQKKPRLEESILSDDPLESENSRSEICMENSIKIEEEEQVECQPNPSFFETEENSSEMFANILKVTFSEGETDDVNNKLCEHCKLNSQKIDVLQENGQQNDDGALCLCSHKFLKQLDEKFSSIKAKISKITCGIEVLKDVVKTQNETIMEALSTQKILTESLVRQEKNNVAIHNLFPINTLKELKALNDAITDENQLIYINAMKLALKGKLTKTLTKILSLQLILEINIDGTHGKKRLKDYAKVFDSLMDAVRNLCDDDPDKEVRYALSVIKKRHFHNMSVERKNNMNI